MDWHPPWAVRGLAVHFWRWEPIPKPTWPDGSLAPRWGTEPHIYNTVVGNPLVNVYHMLPVPSTTTPRAASARAAPVPQVVPVVTLKGPNTAYEAARLPPPGYRIPNTAANDAGAGAATGPERHDCRGVGR